MLDDEQSDKALACPGLGLQISVSSLAQNVGSLDQTQVLLDMCARLF